MIKSRVILLAAVITACVLISCERPEKKTVINYINDYRTVKTLIISSDRNPNEGYIKVQEKYVERAYGKTDVLYLVYRKNDLVGFVTTDRKAYRFTNELLQHETEGQGYIVPAERYVGSWKTLALNVQHILQLRYPVTVF